MKNSADIFHDSSSYFTYLTDQIIFWPEIGTRFHFL
jgi:hypothetical protein